MLKSNCFKRDLKGLKHGAVTITSESEFQARVTRLVKKIRSYINLTGLLFDFVVLNLSCRPIRIIYYKVVCKDQHGVTI